MALGTLGMGLRERLTFPALLIHNMGYQSHSWMVFPQGVRCPLYQAGGAHRNGGILAAMGASWCISNILQVGK